jgi:hypothetical protein
MGIVSHGLVWWPGCESMVWWPVMGEATGNQTQQEASWHELELELYIYIWIIHTIWRARKECPKMAERRPEMGDV